MKKQSRPTVNHEIRKLILIGLVSDDSIMDRLVLKGGNAISIAFPDASNRTSLDLDFSMDTEFNETEFEKIKKTIEGNLTASLEENGYKILDFEFIKNPDNLAEELQNFWGGYGITFKVISKELYEQYKDDPRQLRNYALTTDPQHRKSVEVDISKYEYTKNKTPIDVEGYRIFVYTPAMIVIEKIRAICQQLPEYGPIIKTMKRRPRAKDFFDIYTLLQKFPEIDLNTDENIEMLKQIFEIKRVPLEFLKKLKDQKEFHKPDFESVKKTVTASTKLEEFDFYFNFVVNLVQELKIG